MSVSPIRRLTAEDIGDLLALRRHALETEPFAFESSVEDDIALDPAFLRQQLEPPFPESGSAVLGAFVGGRLVGMLGLFRERGIKLRHKVRFWGLYVEAAHRRKGLGRALVTTGIELSRQLPGVQRVLLGVARPSEWAVGLYESLGFIAYGRERYALWIGSVSVDELHMVRVL
jgi:ribosomal protein S18 acetylase RimI-like enzyme